MSDGHHAASYTPLQEYADVRKNDTQGTNGCEKK